MTRPARRAVALLTSLLLVLTSGVVPPFAPPPVQALEAGHCERFRGQFYVSPCPEFEGVTVDGFSQWHEGFNAEVQQYWMGETVLTLTAHANCSESTDFVTWGLVEYTGGPFRDAMDAGSDTQTARGAAATLKIKPSILADFGFHYLRPSANCHNGFMERNDPAVGVQDWTYLGINGFGDTPPPPANHAPTASCTAARTGPPGRYHFVATASDQDNDALSYAWTYGDGSPTEDGDNRTHDFAKPGHYASQVTVSDGKGGSATADCAVDVPAPVLGLAISLPGRTNGRVALGETFAVRLEVTASADGVGDLADLAFTGDPLRLAPDGALELVDGPTPTVPSGLSLPPGGSTTFDFHVKVLKVGDATLSSRIAGKDAAGATVDSGEITRNLSAPALTVTVKPAKNDFQLDANDDGTPKPEEVVVTITVKNTTTDPVTNVVVGPLDLAAADPARTYDPFPAEVVGANDNTTIGTIPAGESRETTRTVRVLADGRIALKTLVTSDAGNAAGEEDLRVDAQTLLRMTIDGNANRLVNAGSAISFFGRFTNVSNERTVAITDPMKVRRDGNLIGGGLIARTDAPADAFPPPLIEILDPGESVEFEVAFRTERPTIAAYDDGTAALPEWTEASVDFNVWIRAAVREEDESWQALSTENPCACEYPESVVIEGGDLGSFAIEIDTTEPASDGGQFGAAAFGMSVGALQGAQNRLSGLLGFALDVGRFVFNPEFRDDTMNNGLRKGRLKDSLDYLAEFAVWLPNTAEDEVVNTVAGNLATTFGAFDREVSGGLARIPESKTEIAIRAMTREYLRKLQGAWRRGDPNELIDAVMPVGGIVGEQVTDALVGEVVFEALAHMATLPRYYALAKQNWADARTIQQMQDKLPSLALQADLLDATELSKSNFINLENAYQARRELTIAELGGGDNGAGLAADTIATTQKYTADNPNVVIVLVPNEPRVAALRDAGLAIGKIENLKPKSMATIESLVFGGRAEDLNTIVLRDLRWTKDQLNAKVDELIAAGELTEDDRAVAAQILKKRQSEWKVFNDRGNKNPDTGVVTPDKDGIGRLKAYDEAGKIPNQFRGVDNDVPFSGPEQLPRFKLEYYKGEELLPKKRIGEADYVSVLQENPKTGQLVKVVGDDDGIFMGSANGLGLPKEQLGAAYASIWEAFNHPFTDTWLASIGAEVKAKLKIFSRYFTVNAEGRAGAPAVAAMNGKFYAVKLDPYLSRFDPIKNRAYLKWVGLPQAVDPIHPAGWINAVLRSVSTDPLPATFLRSFLHIPGAATDPEVPAVQSAKRARVLRINDQGNVESWTPTLGWHLDPAAQAQAEAGTIAVAPQTLSTVSVTAGATRVEILTQDAMGLAGDWFEVGDLVVLDPGGPSEETAKISGFGSLIFEAPLQHDHPAGTLITLLPASDPETLLSGGPSDPTRSRTAEFTLSSDTQDATFECRLDGGEWAPCVTPATFSDLVDGIHELEVRALAGDRVDATPATVTWRVDTRPPSIGVSVPVAGGVYLRGTSVAASFACADRDGSGVASCSGPATLTTSTRGRQSVTVTAVDRAGNVARRTVTYDVVEPCCRLLVSGTVQRMSAMPLDGSRVSGLLWIFLDPDPAIRSVRFSLDGRIVTTDQRAPWDLWSVANVSLPMPSSLLTRGSHRVVATVTMRDGSTRNGSATFTVVR